jgi:hypothetical protein
MVFTRDVPPEAFIDTPDLDRSVFVRAYIFLHIALSTTSWAHECCCSPGVSRIRCMFRLTCKSSTVWFTRSIRFAEPAAICFLLRALTLHERAGTFNIASGAILGIGAGLLWTAQGSLMLAYPTENNKGKFIAIFWTIFNLGGVVGATVSLGQNYDSSVSGVVCAPVLCSSC